MAAQTIEMSDIEDLQRWVFDLCAQLPDRVVILLEGPMGVGKTQLTRFLVTAMGGDETCSPTFAIHNSYPTSKGRVDHVDLYRLEDEDDLESTGFWDLFEKDTGTIVIEWADRLQQEMLPPHWPILKISMSHGDSDSNRVIRWIGC